MIPTRRQSDDKPAPASGGGLSGLSHVDRKSLTPRPAPTTMLNPSNASLASGNTGGLGMTTNQIRNAHPPGTSQNHITAMKRHMNQGANFQSAHNMATQQGFPAKRRGMGLSKPSTKTVGFTVLMAAVAGGSYFFYTRRNLRDALAEEEDDSE